LQKIKKNKEGVGNREGREDKEGMENREGMEIEKIGKVGEIWKVWKLWKGVKGLSTKFEDSFHFIRRILTKLIIVKRFNFLYRPNPPYFLYLK